MNKSRLCAVGCIAESSPSLTCVWFVGARVGLLGYPSAPLAALFPTLGW